MPLKPSGHTPTSSPPDEHPLGVLGAGQGGTALAGQRAHDRHLEDEVGAQRAQEAAGVVVHRQHGHQAVERDGAGVVGDHQRAALGGDVLQAADLEPEPLLRDRSQRRHEEALGQLAVEAVVVHRRSRRSAGDAGTPSARRARRSQSSPKISTAATWSAAASRPPGCRPAGWRSVGGRGRAGRVDGAAGADAAAGAGAGFFDGLPGSCGAAGLAGGGGSRCGRLLLGRRGCGRPPTVGRDLCRAPVGHRCRSG